MNENNNRCLGNKNTFDLKLLYNVTFKTMYCKFDKQWLNKTHFPPIFNFSKDPLNTLKNFEFITLQTKFVQHPTTMEIGRNGNWPMREPDENVDEKFMLYLFSFVSVIKWLTQNLALTWSSIDNTSLNILKQYVKSTKQCRSCYS